MPSEKIQIDIKTDAYVTYLRCLNYIEKKAKDEGHQIYSGDKYPIEFIKREMIKYIRDNFIPDESQKLYIDLYKYLENQLIFFGPITELLNNSNVKKIYIEGAKQISYRNSTNNIIDTEIMFKNSVQVTKLINRFMIGKKIEFNIENPIVDIVVENIGRVFIIHKSLNKDDDDHMTIMKTMN